MKLLVTGGAGFIGSNFIRYWLEKYPKDAIVNLDKLTYAGNLENLKNVTSDPRYAFVRGDIMDTRVVERVMGGVETVVHFAAETHVDRSINGPSEFVRTNVLGSQVLLEAALKHKVKRFHHISTDEVFGSLSLDSNEKFNEQTPYDPHSPYAASKAASDHLVRAYQTTFGLPITISNCSNNFGPYQFPEKLIPLFVTNLMEGKKVPVYGDGLYTRDWIYVADHCRAIDLILQEGKVGEIYCVGGGNELSNLEVVRRILKIMGKDESWIMYVKDRPGHDRRYAVDASKIRKELDWAPEHNFDEWLEKTIDWYQQNENWWRKLKAVNTEV